MPRGLKRKSVAIQLLKELSEGLDEYLALAYQPSAVLRAGGLDAYLEKQRWREFDRSKRALRRLARLEYLELEKKGEKLLAQLTEKGFATVLKELVLTKKEKLPFPFKTYVSFDVPQATRHVRSAIRDLLKRARFKMLHQSLWETDRNVAKELAALIKVLGAEDWVHVSLAVPLTNVLKKPRQKHISTKTI